MYKDNFNSIIRQFDNQIRRESKIFGGDKERCPSFWEKTLFTKTINLDLSDWRKIRGGDYWEKRDSLNGIDRIMFICSRVDKYLNVK